MGSDPLPSRESEREVILSCRAQDGEGFDLLYRHYAAPLRNFCRGRLSDVDDAEDACHEALIRAYQAFPRFREGMRAWPWLATIAANVCIDIERTRRSVPVSETPTRHTRRAEPSADPHEQVVSKWRRDAVREAMSAVPLRYRGPMQLCDLEGWTYHDVAELQGTTVASVRSALVRGHRFLREQLSEMVASGRLALPLLSPLAALRRLRRAFSDSGVESVLAPASGPLAAFVSVATTLVIGAAVTVVISTSAGAGGVDGSHATPPAASAASAIPAASADLASTHTSRPTAAPSAGPWRTERTFTAEPAKVPMRADVPVGYGPQDPNINSRQLKFNATVQVGSGDLTQTVEVPGGVEFPCERYVVFTAVCALTDGVAGAH